MPELAQGCAGCMAKMNGEREEKWQEESKTVVIAASHHAILLWTKCCVFSHLSACEILLIKGCGMSCRTGMDGAVKMQNAILAILLKYIYITLVHQSLSEQ